MGYSIAARCKNKKIQDMMYKFLEKNLRDTNHVYGFSDQYVISYRLCPPRSKDNGMSYDNSILGLGFDYSCMPEIERFYIFSVCRWISLKIGKKKHFKGLGSYPYIVYDGCEVLPIIPNPKEVIPKEYSWAVTDELGYKSVMSNRPKTALSYMSVVLMMKWPKVDKITNKELVKLDNLWNSFILKK